MFIANKPIFTVNTTKSAVNSTSEIIKRTDINSVDKESLRKLNRCFLNYKQSLNRLTDCTSIGVLDNLYEYNTSSKKQIPTSFLLKNFNSASSLEKNLSYKNTDFLNIRFSGSNSHRSNLLKVFKYLVDNKIVFDIS